MMDIPSASPWRQSYVYTTKGNRSFHLDLPERPNNPITLGVPVETGEGEPNMSDSFRLKGSRRGSELRT